MTTVLRERMGNGAWSCVLKAIALMCMVTILSVAHADDLQAIDDAGLEGITGTGNGLAFDLLMQLNTDSTGTPVGTSTQSTACQGNTTGCPFLLALQVENRTGGWLVFKDYYGLMKINNLNLDAYDNPSTGGTNTFGNTVYWNKSRFASSAFQASLTCISDIGSTTCNPAGMNSFSLSFNNTGLNYKNIQLYMNIGRMAVEYDNNVAGACASVNDTTNCGYVQDNRGSFAGVVVSDIAPLAGAGPGAVISIRGQARIYGF